MIKHEFTTENDINVEAIVIDSDGNGEKDFIVIMSNGEEFKLKGIDNGNDVMVAVEEHGGELTPLSRHFNEFVITACMISEDTTLDEALAFQAGWKAGRTECGDTASAWRKDKQASIAERSTQRKECDKAEDSIRPHDPLTGKIIEATALAISGLICFCLVYFL